MIQIGNRSEIKAEGIGNIPLETESSHMTLQDVLYVPNIGSNLLSVAKIVDHGHSLLFTPSKCQIQNTEGRVKGVREGNVYVLRAKKEALAALTNTDITVSAETWHRCLGHQNLDGPAMVSIQKAVVGLEVSETTLNSEDTRVCETCAIGRQHKETMTGKRKKVEKLLECIHSDVCRPMQTPTLSGELYFVTFVDEASGWLTEALHRSKAEVFENFAVYRQRAEKDTGKAVKSLRSDGGGEYMSEKFLTYL